MSSLETELLVCPSDGSASGTGPKLSFLSPKPVHRGVGENLMMGCVKTRTSAGEGQLRLSLWTQVGISLAQAGQRVWRPPPGLPNVMTPGLPPLASQWEVAPGEVTALLRLQREAPG